MPETQKLPLTKPQEKFKKKFLNAFLFRLHALSNVPAGFVAGMKLISLDTNKAVSTIPYKYLNKNPFRSMYFAVQSMAAELSTASLALLAIEGIVPSVALIVVDLSAEFHKKATGKVTFTCTDGALIFDAVERCISSSEPTTVKAKTTGTMADGTLVSTFYFTWSFKQRAA
ncbi:MAG: thioesterase [Bacteroidetes bacterium]|nr:thioesterase [Bacteroidota bacterium]MDA1122151.1 thioesterase [Bacteroidota bacterium]